MLCIVGCWEIIVEIIFFVPYLSKVVLSGGNGTAHFHVAPLLGISFIVCKVPVSKYLPYLLLRFVRFSYVTERTLRNTEPYRKLYIPQNE